jgi:antitoxin component YwqK of YwqJK toxin-antitoxin module
MKNLTLLLLLFSIVSCSDSINDDKYRNSDYVFFEAENGASEWLKIEEGGNFDNYSPGQYSYFFDDGKQFCSLLIKDSFSKNREEYYYDQNEKKFNTKIYINDSLVKETYTDGYHTEFHTTKKDLLSEGRTKNNKKEGTWKYYSKESGALECIQDWKNDKQHGLRLEYLTDETLSNKSYWKEDIQNGLTVHYYENGNIEDSMNVVDGYEHGTSYYYYENNILKSVSNFFRGKRIDSSIYYYNNGNVKSIGIYNLDTTTMICRGNTSIYFENGVINKSYQTLNEIPHGKVIIYYPTGKIKQIYYLSNDLLMGDAVEYHENGKVHYQAATNNGHFDGRIKYYSSESKIYKEVTFKNGVKIDSIVY